jgi:hypothetical protein
LWTVVVMPHPITKPCGTYAAAARHKRRGEPLCEPCIEARREWWRERARIAYSIPAFRQRENARAAARLAKRRATDPQWRQEQNARRYQRQRKQRANERKLARLIVDPIVVERLVAGVTVKATTREKRAAFDVLTSRGVAPSRAAEQLSTSWSTAKRWAVHSASPRHIHRDNANLFKLQADHSHTAANDEKLEAC